jgi:hypothetical protein
MAWLTISRARPIPSWHSSHSAGTIACALHLADGFSNFKMVDYPAVDVEGIHRYYLAEHLLQSSFSKVLVAL